MHKGSYFLHIIIVFARSSSSVHTSLKQKLIPVASQTRVAVCACELSLRREPSCEEEEWMGSGGEKKQYTRVKYFERLAEETPQPSPLHPRVHVVVKIRKIIITTLRLLIFCFSPLFTVLQPPFHLHSSSYASFSPFLFCCSAFFASVHSLFFHCIFTCATGLAEIKRFLFFCCYAFFFYFGRCCGHFTLALLPSDDRQVSDWNSEFQVHPSSHCQRSKFDFGRSSSSSRWNCSLDL